MARMEDNVMVASEQILPGNTGEVAEFVVAHIISTSYPRRSNKHWKAQKMHLTTTAKIQHVHDMMHDMARCNLSQVKRNRDSDN